MPNHMRLHALLSAILLSAAAAGASAEDIRIVAPYGGAITNFYENETYKIDLEDTGFMTGLYAQWIRPELFQANTFLYYSPEVNDSRIFGGHLNADLYFDVQPRTKNAVGAGLELIRIDMELPDEDADPLTGFTLENSVTAVYGRLGRYFLLESDNSDLSIMPWLGVEFDFIRGDVAFHASVPRRF